MKNWWKYSKLRSTYHNVKWFCWNVWRYRKGLYYEVRPWDSHGAMWMFKEIIRDIRDTMQDESGAQEVAETRIPKEQDINRVIRLIENKHDDEYASRSGYNFDYNIKFIPAGSAFEMVSDESEEVAKQNEVAIQKAFKLEEEEHKELIQLISKYREWWI